MKKLARKSLGFTIVEIIAVVLIIALTMMISIMAIYHSVEQAALNSSGNDLLRMARFGRFLAIETQSPCVMHIDMTAGTYWFQAAEMVQDPFDQKKTIPVDNIYRKVRKLPENVFFVKADIADKIFLEGLAKIKFYRDGRNESSLIQISSGKQINTLLLAENGVIRLASGPIAQSVDYVVDLDEMSLDADAIFVK